MSVRFAAVILACCIAAGSQASAANGVRVVYRGSCTVEGGLHDKSKAWDVWQEIFQTGSPTWLHAHTHDGAECIMNVAGVTSWWFAPGTTVPVRTGQSVYTIEGRVHTAGNVSGRAMQYLGIHVLEQGAPFNRPVDDPHAPPLQSTALLSIFKREFPNQPPSAGTFTIENRIEEYSAGASYSRPASSALAYYTVVCGNAAITIGATTTPLRANESLAIPRGAAARIAAPVNALLAVTELVPAR